MTDTVQTVYLDTVVKLVGDQYSQYIWSMTDIKLPVRMSNFGVAQIPDASLFCKDGGFQCEHDVFPPQVIVATISGSVRTARRLTRPVIQVWCSIPALVSVIGPTSWRLVHRLGPPGEITLLIYC